MFYQDLEDSEERLLAIRQGDLAPEKKIEHINALSLAFSKIDQRLNEARSTCKTVEDNTTLNKLQQGIQAGKRLLEHMLEHSKPVTV